MNTSSSESVADPRAARWLPSSVAFAKRFFGFIDRPSFLLALKSCLAISLAVGFAFWWNISPTITAVTAFMIQQSYVGSTIYRGALRFIGGITGALLALVALGLFSQDRVLFIGSVAICAGVIVYFLQATRYWYAYILCLASLTVVGYGSVEHPQYAFNFAINWVSGILLAVVCVSVVRGLLWPNLTANVFEQQLRDNTEKCRKLLQMTVDSLVDGKERSAQLDGLEQSIIHGLVQPQTTLQTAFFDSWQVDRFESSYNHFLNRFNSLAKLIIESREHLRIVQTHSALADMLQQSEMVRQLASELDNRMQDFIAALEQPRDGASCRPDLDSPDAIEVLCSRMADETYTAGVDLFDKAALLGLLSKLKELGKRIPELQEALTCVETVDAESAARADATTHQVAPPLKRRMIKAATASILMIAVPAIWIITNWPMALSRVMVYTGVLACFNAMFPAIPRRAILTALAWGILGGAIMHLAVMRPLEGFPELAVAMSLALLPCCYFVNSPNPLTMIRGLFAGMIIIGLMDLSLQQSYSFSNLVNNAIGYSGGFMIAMVVLLLFVHSTPEQTFRKNVLAFFHSCGQAVETTTAEPPWTEKGESCLASEQSRTLTTFKMCGLWSRMIDPRRAPENDAKKVKGLLGAMQALKFRLAMLEQARFAPPDASPLISLVSAERKTRECLKQSLDSIQAVIRGNASPEAKIQELRIQLESLRGDQIVDSSDRETAGRILVLAGYYRALTDAVEQCCEQVIAINWQQWERNYI